MSWVISFSSRFSSVIFFFAFIGSTASLSVSSVVIQITKVDLSFVVHDALCFAWFGPYLYRQPSVRNFEQSCQNYGLSFIFFLLLLGISAGHTKYQCKYLHMIIFCPLTLNLTQSSTFHCKEWISANGSLNVPLVWFCSCRGPNLIPCKGFWPNHERF